MNALFVDGHNFLFKSYAVPFNFASKKGTPLHVVSTFLNLLRRSIKATNAQKLCIVFDSEVATDNHEFYSDYKANRNYDYSAVEMSPFDHLPLIKQALTAAEIAWIEQPGSEADDIIATSSKIHLAQESDNYSYIASTDTDFFQLLSDNCSILKLLPKGAHTVLTSAYVVDTYAIHPSRYAELKAWVGDKADNITGIPGIGWKRAAEIVNGTRKKELNAEEQAILERNLKLITLNGDLPINPKFSDISTLERMNNTMIFAQANF